MAEVKNVALPENRIQVSNTKKPLFFYVNLAKVRRGGLCATRRVCARSTSRHARLQRPERRPRSICEHRIGRSVL
eukprot:1189617-Prorocentrum_minimum.AAC.3